ncbi:hypothetical protein NG798_15915 [Ancylothrix sp. C2]|uniref:hypothetical protein n=1 Tax=Ancylothrix sp. D3o TaxID=2953691 RepID=UPI0021BAD83B|nr:hypothetical protein [Ancylothrix sp. D3o]MCT7951287.1 hypothetical protein [Ancylothrix sp. D3o]
MAYWLFQGNPKYYRLWDAIRDSKQMAWLMTRYANQIIAKEWSIDLAGRWHSMRG